MFWCDTTPPTPSSPRDGSTGCSLCGAAFQLADGALRWCVGWRELPGGEAHDAALIQHAHRHVPPA
eukprot:6637504-Pyramimonas_sp.AAC.1